MAEEKTPVFEFSADEMSEGQGSETEFSRDFEEEFADETREEFRKGKERFKEAGERLGERGRSRVKSLLSEQQERMADQLESLAEALQETSRNLKEQGQNMAAGVAERAATEIDELSAYLAEQDFRDIVLETGERINRRPGLYLGGAFVAGIFAARFLKSSGQG